MRRSGQADMRFFAAESDLTECKASTTIAVTGPCSPRGLNMRVEAA